MPTLDWIGKQHVTAHHLEVPYRVLERRWSFDAAAGRQAAEGSGGASHGSGNMIIRGDNLHALKSLLPRYAGRVKCIYIDPPYNTGNEGWVYNDNVNAPQIKKWLGEVVGKEGEDLSRHDKWLCMMYPRLKLLHKLLAEDGAIFISIDDNEKHTLKILCDEIFGGNNFVADVVVISNLKGRSDDKYIATAHEDLLVYQKGGFISKGVEIPDEYDEEYKLCDEHGRYRLQGLRKRGSGAKREDRPNMFYPFFYSKQDNLLSVDKIPNSIEIYPRLSDGSDGRWRWGIDTARSRISELTVQIVKGRGEYDVFQKDYLPQEGVKRIKPKSFWIGTEFSTESGTLEVKAILGKGIFETPKPTGLIEYILQQVTEDGDIVLDSFAGSGTTAHAVLKQNAEDGGNRKFILVEMEDYAESITAERVQRVIAGYGEGKNAVPGTGGGFSFYELGEPLLFADGNLNEAVGAARIREYVWHMETGQPAMPDCSATHPALLGCWNAAAYWFHYAPQQETVLNQDFLATLPLTMPEAPERHIMYADVCALSEAQLERWRIQFKKIPRDIRKL